MKKILLAVLLCTVLLMTILPASAFAEGGTAFYIGNAIRYADANDSLWTTCPTTQVDNITMEAWVKADSLSAGDTNIRIMYNGDSSANGYGIYIRGNKPSILMGGVTFADISGVTLGTSQWYHLAAVRDRGNWTLYVNGTGYTPIGGANVSVPYAPAIGLHPNGTRDLYYTFSVGNSDVANENFTGSIDEVRFWTVARSAQQIRDNMYIKLAGDETGLLAYYNFDQGIAGGDNTNPRITTATDLAGGDNNLTISSGFALNGNSSNFVSSVQLGTFALGSDAYTVNDGGSLTIPIVRTGGSEGSVTISYATSDGTAAAGTHYTSTAGSVTFAEGQTEKSIQVPILFSSITEQKQFSFTISGQSGVSVTSPSTATVTILPTLTGVTLGTVPSPLILGTTLSVATVTPDGATYDCQWFRVDGEGTETALTSGNSYTVTEDDLGNSIRVKATGNGIYLGTVEATTTESVTVQNTVSFDNGSGTPASSDSVTAAWGTPMPDLSGEGKLPSRRGYTFTGYWDAASEGTKYYNADGSSAKNWDKTVDATLYAQWTAESYTVTYNANGGTNASVTETTATYDAAMPDLTGEGKLPVLKGYDFAGYWDAESGGDQYYNADGSGAKNWDKTAASTLYAQWTLSSYTVTYDDNGATTAHGGGDTSYTIDTASLTLPTTAPLKTGYTFDGWKVTSAASGGTGLALNDKFTDASRVLSGAYGDVTLTAQWTANEYAVTLDGQNATVAGTASATATYDDEMPNITKPQRGYTVTFSYDEAAGGFTPDNLAATYTFDGYFDETVGGTMYYDANVQSARVWDKTENATLYAHWTAASCVLLTPEKTGFDFAGWYTDEAFTTLAGAADTSYTPTADVTLYAKWVPKTYAVTLTPGAGYTLTAISGSKSPVKHGEDYTFSFALQPAYSTSTPVVMVNGVQVTLTAGVYTISNITEPITVTVTGLVQGYRVSLPDANLPAADTAEIDGVEYSLTPGTGVGTAMVPDDGAHMAVVTTENAPGAADVHTIYPEHMTVWELTFSQKTNSYTANYIEEFDDLLQYSGCSIRLTGKPGIRMITSVPTGIRNLLKGRGVNGYTLEETGTLVAWADKVGTGPLTLGQSYANSAYAYKRGVTDPIFAKTGELTRYTNVLVDFSMDQCIPDLVMRPYIILRDSDGNRHTIYGGTVQRSIGYIAWQNRAVYAEGTTEYNYVWNIINYCQDHGVTY